MRNKDDFDEYFADTMRAGHNENNPEAVECMIRSSQEVINDLVKYGVEFDRQPNGSFAYTREGGHSSPRILYHKDCTGKEIMLKLLHCIKKHKNVQLVPENTLLDIIEDGEKCIGGVVLDNDDKSVKCVYADYTVLATGGIGGALGNSTNYPVITGDGVVICLRHGVAVDNINYIQIHPTTLYVEMHRRRFLISESVRGEGAVLLDKNFKRFTDELQPRDIVRNAVVEQMKKDGTEFVWLDMRPIPKEHLKNHFPQIVEQCAKRGFDVFKEPIPVVPAIHYFMGGIRSDLDGRTTMDRLYAVGETCCNGVHGRNRLASNSLLESLLFAKRAALHIVNNYSPLDMAEITAVNVDMRKYADPEQLMRSYKYEIGLAVRLAEDGKDVNKLFKERKRRR